MQHVTGWVSVILLLSEAGGGCQAARGQTVSPPAAPAAIEGRITVVETINRTVTTRPLRNLTVYLFTLQQSKPLLELQRKCRKSMARPEAGAANAFTAYQVCMQSQSQAVDLVPRLAATASTKTDADGVYKV